MEREERVSRSRQSRFELGSGRGRQSLQTGLDGCKVCFPGAEAVVQLLPLLLAKGAMCAVAAGEGAEER